MFIDVHRCVCVCVRLNSSCCTWSEPSGWRWREREREREREMWYTNAWFSIHATCKWFAFVWFCVLLTSPVVAIYKTHTHTTMRQLPNAQNTCAHILAYSHNDWTPRDGEGERLTWGSWGSWLKPVGWQINGFVWTLFFHVFSQIQWLIIMFQRTCRLRPWCSARGVWRPDFSDQGGGHF